MGRILYLTMAALALYGARAAAQDNAVTLIERAGLIGAWATDCGNTAATPNHFRLVFAKSMSGGLTYTTTNLDQGVRMTIQSAVLAAVPVDDNRLKITFRITGGNRNGGPLPSPTTSVFEQTIERIDVDRIRLVNASGWLWKCRG